MALGQYQLLLLDRIALPEKAGVQFSNAFGVEASSGIHLHNKEGASYSHFKPCNLTNKQLQCALQESALEKSPRK